jgi:hypothetical protein
MEAGPVGNREQLTQDRIPHDPGAGREALGGACRTMLSIKLCNPLRGRPGLEPLKPLMARLFCGISRNSQTNDP